MDGVGGRGMISGEIRSRSSVYLAAAAGAETRTCGCSCMFACVCVCVCVLESVSVCLWVAEVLSVNGNDLWASAT